MFYSNTAFGYFQQCKLKYKFKYIDGEKEYFNTVESFLGDKVHVSLEKLYKDLKFSKLLSLGELINYYKTIWDKHWNDNIRIVKREYSAEHYKKIGEEHLKNYYNKYKPFNQDKTIDIECWINFKIDENTIIRGKIDRLAKSDEKTYVIHDYKTTQKLPTQAEIDSDRQLALYQIGVINKWPFIKKIKFIYHFLAFNEEMESSRTNDQIEATKREILDLVKEIQETKNFPPKETALCDWCEFQPICPRRKHIFFVDSLPPEEYREENGVKLVNEYVKIWHEERKINAKLEDIKNKIYIYAWKNNLRAIKGSDYKLYVKTGKEIRFPKKDEENYEELKKFLIEIGKYEEVSSINPWHLKKIVESNNWGFDITKKLAKFSSNVKNTWVSQPYPLKGD